MTVPVEYILRVKPLPSGYAASCSRLAGTAHPDVRAVIGQVGHGQGETEPAAMLAAIVDARIGVVPSTVREVSNGA